MITQSSEDKLMDGVSTSIAQAYKLSILTDPITLEIITDDNLFPLTYNINNIPTSAIKLSTFLRLWEEKY